MMMVVDMPVLVVHRSGGSETTISGTVSGVDGDTVDVEAFVGRSVHAFPGLMEDDGAAEWA